MAVSIVIKAEKGSLYFPERIIVLEGAGSLRVSRCGREEKPNFNNAIFDSRVLQEQIVFFQFPVLNRRSCLNPTPSSVVMKTRCSSLTAAAAMEHL